MQLAASVTVDDGRGTAATTNYAYADGLWSFAARQFMALISADLPNEPGRRVAPSQVEAAARNGVKTFLRAFGPRRN